MKYAIRGFLVGVVIFGIVMAVYGIWCLSTAPTPPQTAVTVAITPCATHTLTDGVWSVVSKECEPRVSGVLPGHVGFIPETGNCVAYIDLPDSVRGIQVPVHRSACERLGLVGK
jgi:hypothetical protein